mmetsp:Transcript_22838/g.64650  ORF Transcript_22838/g.64650 Transcript_22838/m.64650 type:complete len:292 (-) Transcript_22838:456-1331(-)
MLLDGVLDFSGRPDDLALVDFGILLIRSGLDGGQHLEQRLHVLQDVGGRPLQHLVGRRVLGIVLVQVRDDVLALPHLDARVGIDDVRALGGPVAATHRQFGPAGRPLADGPQLVHDVEFREHLAHQPAELVALVGVQDQRLARAVQLVGQRRGREDLATPRPEHPGDERTENIHGILGLVHDLSHNVIVANDLLLLARTENAFQVHRDFLDTVQNEAFWFVRFRDDLLHDQRRNGIAARQVGTRRCGRHNLLDANVVSRDQFAYLAACPGVLDVVQTFEFRELCQCWCGLR